MSIAIEVAALTDMGCVRTNNEDNYGYDSSYHLYAVCDGMGGMASGEVASGLAIASLLESYVKQSVPTVDSEEIPKAEIRLFNAVLAANEAVCHVSNAKPEHYGMGTTLVAACLDNNRIVLANVGDSRAYLIHQGQCMQITVDHSYANELIRAGARLPSDSDTTEMQSVITRAIGASSIVEPDLYALEPADLDTVLLASDGLTRYVTEAEVAALVLSTDLEAICADLIATAKSRGGVDNITCLLLRFHWTDL